MSARNRRIRRGALLVGFFGTLILLVGVVLSSYVQSGDSQLSAYDDDWNDISAFRHDVNDMGIETRSVVSSPLLLKEIDDPGNATFVISGVEKDAFTMPHFGESGFIEFDEPDGYSTAEIEAIVDFYKANGTVIVMDDFGFSSGLAAAFGWEFNGNQLYDSLYAPTLNRSFVWTCLQIEPCGMSNLTVDIASHKSHPLWDGSHPCAMAAGEAIVSEEGAGLCAHHLEAGMISYNSTYQILMNGPTILENATKSSKLGVSQAIASTSKDASIDVNGDGEVMVGQEQNEETPDRAASIEGNFVVAVEICESRCESAGEGIEGRVIFVADGSILSNAMYDYEGYNKGDYTGGSTPAVEMPANDNRKWALDVIALALLTDTNGSLEPSENALVIFDESRHSQNAFLGESYNMIYWILVYFTSESMAMLVLFVGLFIAFEAVVIKKKDPEPWRHVFSIIYYGFGDARRYGYYAKSNKIKQVFLSRVRNNNGLTREEFDAMPASDLQQMINDPVLVKFVFENRDYSLEQMVTIVKRIKVWGKT
ncbi:MAG: hypothetical protein QF707_05510 [Candidatus Poseidoniaceae archaeon]|jgi:hypothetical protein|nr:hypothetical protein [Candidatus Poseidoniaceae archaeon]MDP7203147.1 hypothetical protein [Candidatus Poseidoniaceae archaeon]